jgi:hypothetical protein
MRKETVTEQSPNTRISDNHNYNCPNDSSHAAASGPGKIDVIIPPHLQEFGTGAARALLHLIIEVHRGRATDNEQPTEDT